MITGPLFVADVLMLAVLIWLAHDNWGVEERDV